MYTPKKQHSTTKATSLRNVNYEGLLSRNCHTLAFNAEMGIWQTMMKQVRFPQVQRNVVRHKKLDLSRPRCHVVMLWFRDAIASPCSYVGLKDTSQAD